MDSVTQLVLGAGIAGACVPDRYRRQAMLAGAALGTLPDLDVFIDYGNAVANFTLHRGFSHSLFVLIPFATLLWFVLKHFYEPVKQQPKHWWWAITLALVTHPLLDAHTAYGTQLFWPLDITPAMWSTLFIIDPLYTIPLLVAFIVGLVVPYKTWTRKFLIGCLVVSSSYLGWSWVAKYQVSQQVQVALNQSVGEYKIFTTPTPFNTLMWRIVVNDGENYKEGYYHFLFPGEIQFNDYSLNRNLFTSASQIADVKQLQWFADQFNRAELINDTLVITDLRMGFEDNYVFRHQVARRTDNGWQEIKSELLPRQLDGADWGTFKDMFMQRH